MRLTGLVSTAFIVALLCETAPAAVPAKINYQGMLRDSTGAPVPNNVYTLAFKIYDDSIGGTTLWSETLPVQVTDGLFSVILGTTNPLDTAIVSPGSPLYMGVKVNLAPEIAPRTELVSVAYALRSEDAAVATLAQDLVCAGCVGVSDIDPTQIQRRVTGTAPPGEFVTGVNQDGSVSSGAPVSFNKIVSTFIHQNATRTVLSQAASITLESFLYTKTSPTSYLLIQGTISGFGSHSGAMMQGWKLGAGSEVLAQGVQYTGETFTNIGQTTAVISGQTTTGSQVMTLRYFAQNGSAAERPFIIYNPNSTDDARQAQTRSVYVIWEIEP